MLPHSTVRIPRAGILVLAVGVPFDPVIGPTCEHLKVGEIFQELLDNEIAEV
jgi:hypothetical protein